MPAMNVTARRLLASAAVAIALAVLLFQLHKEMIAAPSSNEPYTAAMEKPPWVPSKLVDIRAPSTSWCMGILDGIACCHRSCGQCGGPGCKHRPGGPSLCCAGSIRKTRRPCARNCTSGCVVPLSTAPLTGTTSQAQYATWRRYERTRPTHSSLGVAVCITGQLSRVETASKVKHILKPLSSQLRKMVHVFLALEKGSFAFVNPQTHGKVSSSCRSEPELAAIEKELAPFHRASRVVRHKDRMLNLSKWPRYRANLRWDSRQRRLNLHVNQHRAARDCLRLVKRAEAASGGRYSVLIKLRDNAVALRRMELPASMDDRVIVKRCNSWYGVNDKAMIVPRQRAVGALARTHFALLAIDKGANAMLEERVAKRTVNSETLLKHVLDVYQVPVDRVNNIDTVLPVADGRCASASRGKKTFCLVMACKDCRPARPWAADAPAECEHMTACIGNQSAGNHAQNQTREDYTELPAVHPSAVSLAFRAVCPHGAPQPVCPRGNYEDTDDKLCAVSCREGCRYNDLTQPAFRIDKGLVVHHERDEREYQHECIVARRVRLSACTDIALVSRRYFVSASYGAREIYLWRYSLKQRSADLIAYTNTTWRGEPTWVDLMDWDGRDRIIMSNFRKGSQSVYKFDVRAKTIQWVEEHQMFAPVHLPRWCHSAKFVPGTSHIVATSTLPGHFATGVYDTETNELLYEFSLDPAWHAQDTELIGSSHLLVAYTSSTVRTFQTEKSNITEHRAKLSLLDRSQACMQPRRGDTPAGTKVALYAIDLRIPTEHMLLDVHDIPEAHPDSIVYSEGLVYVNDQFNDVIHVLQLNMTVETGSGLQARIPKLKRLLSIRGYHMPHGVDVRDGVIAVTNYGDNTAKIMKLPLELDKHRIPTRPEMAR